MVRHLLLSSCCRSNTGSKAAAIAEANDRLKIWLHLLTWTRCYSNITHSCRFASQSQEASQLLQLSKSIYAASD